MKKIILFIAFTVCILIAYPQISVSPGVLSATGYSYGACGNFQVNYTVGETAVSTIGSPSGAHITQGFEQPVTPAYEEIVPNLPGCITEIRNMESSEIPFMLYPNPTDGDYRIRFTAPAAGTAGFEVSDVNGRQITLKQENCSAGTIEKQFDINRISAGTYLLKMTFTTSSGQLYTAVKRLSIINQ